MPPRGRGAKSRVNAPSKTPVRSRALKAHKIPPPLPNGEIVTDVKKKQWIVGNGIGQGGFGLIYLASDDVDHPVGTDAEYVMKVEPRSNGPLFCEIHFYQRAAKAELIDHFARSKKLKYLGIPKFITTGQHLHNGVDYRFLVMPRFGTDLQKVFETCGKHFSKKSVYSLGLRLLDMLEFMHENEYVHADIKAANILLGCKRGAIVNDEVYLVDFGLAFRYIVEGKHKEYKEDPKRAHDGTVEFTSIDAHKGVAPSRRGDLEILGYCLLQWLCGQLPWEDNLNNKDYVRVSKIRHMKNTRSLMDVCFPDGDQADELRLYLDYVKALGYDEQPDYDKLRKTLRSGLAKLGKKSEWALDLQVQGKKSTQPVVKKQKAQKRKSSSPPPKQVIKCRMTPAMEAQAAKMASAASESALSKSKKTANPKRKTTPADATLGRRIVRRTHAVSSDIAVQTSPGLVRNR